MYSLPSRTFCHGSVHFVCAAAFISLGACSSNPSTPSPESSAPSGDTSEGTTPNATETPNDGSSDETASEGGTATDPTEEETDTEPTDPTEPVEPMDPCEDGVWTCLRTEPSGPYGTRTFQVPAQQNWVNSGLYLREGETATISPGAGSWILGSKDGDGIDHGACIIGDLVARIGLHYKDPKLTCVADELVFTADKDGILFVGALSENDLGEGYEARFHASGEKTVTVTSEAATAPTILGGEAETYAFDQVSSGWIEVMGDHVILTIPTDKADEDSDVILQAIETLDTLYTLEADLRGGVPHHGQRIRFFPDSTTLGYMLAGNPIRMQPSLVTDGSRITLAGQEGIDIWGFAHELGHDFSYVSRNWVYETSTNTLESWCNIFTVYALGEMAVALNPSTVNCNQDSTGDYNSGWDAWVGVCFLRQFQFRYGWKFYEDFFAILNMDEDNQGISTWAEVHDAFETVAGEDITPLFDAWNVPH